MSNHMKMVRGCRRKLKRGAWAVGGCVISMLALMIAAVVPAGATTAGEVQLNGGWAPFGRCPVDNPDMLAADGVEVIALCLASDSPAGSIKLGNSTISTGESNLQFGLLNKAGKYTIVVPDGGAIVSDAVDIPGGLLGLMCPSDIPVVYNVCDAIVNNRLNRVVATVEPAGKPSDFDIAAGLMSGKPILTLPVKVHLENPLLGSGCYIGSKSDPIVLHPENLTLPSGSQEQFAGDGTPQPGGVMSDIVLTGASQGDDGFAVPGASGCGIGGLLDWAVNLKQGLPSDAGNNSVVLNDASTRLAGISDPAATAPDDGKELSTYWHSAVTR